MTIYNHKATGITIYLFSEHIIGSFYLIVSREKS